MGSGAAWARERFSWGSRAFSFGLLGGFKRKIVCGLLILTIQDWSEQTGQSQERGRGERGGTQSVGGHHIRGQPVAGP